MSDNNYTPVNPLGIFPNWIFCPKIVPLVYDDSLSYYEFLNKLMVKLNEVITFANQINANVDYLRTIVERIQELVDGFDERITANEQDIANLKTAMETVNTAIEGINSTLTDMQGDIDANSAAIENLAQDLEREISTAIGPLQATVESLSRTTANNTSRIETLEQAAFDPSQIVFSNMPFNFALSTLNGNSNNMRIVVDGSGAASDAIQWVDGGHYAPGGNIPNKQKFNSTFKVPRFYSSGNACHLVIPSIFPIKYGATVNWTLYFYANRWIGATSGNTGICKVGPINFTDLLAEGGVQQSTVSAGTGCFNDIELFANQETGCYDLYIYNGRNNKYTWINDYIISSLMILPVDLGNVGITAGVQKYFNLLNTFLTQSNANIDSKITSAVNTALIPVNDAIGDLDTEVSNQCLNFNNLIPLDFTPLSGITVNFNHSRQIYGVVGSRRASILFLDMQIDVTGLESDSAMSIGQLDIFMGSVANARSIEVAIEAANNGAFGSMSSNGSLTIKAFGTFGATTRMRITGTIADIHEVTT